MKNGMRLAWQREVSVREGGREGWPVANHLQCNLHSCGWISDVGVLYKGIWLPAELHDIQLAPWRVSTHTHMCSHRCTCMRWYGGRQKARQSSVWFIRRIIRKLESSSPRQTQKQTLYTQSTPHKSLARPSFVSPRGASQSVCPCPAPSTAAVIPTQDRPLHGC